MIETERLILRPWQDTDVESLFKYAKDPRVGPMAGWPVHTSVENSLDIIHGVLSEPETYAVVLKETNEAVGSVGIMIRPEGFEPMKAGEAEIGYWIGVPYWGRGLIPEAVYALLRRCFLELNCERVWCAYFDGNVKSQRVQEKCGFKYQQIKCKPLPDGGERKVHLTMQTLEEWAPLHGFKPGRYRHFKGNEYELMYLARHSETRELLCVYRALYGEGGIWARPARMWDETVEREGAITPRFSYIQD